MLNDVVAEPQDKRCGGAKGIGLGCGVHIEGSIAAVQLVARGHRDAPFKGELVAQELLALVYVWFAGGSHARPERGQGVA